MLTNKYSITGQMFTGMFFLGAAAVVIGNASRNVDLPPDQIGLLIASQSVGFMVAVFGVGMLADRYANNWLLASGSMLLCIALLSVFRTNLFFLNFFLIMLMGAGMGSYEAVTDPVLLRTHTGRQELFININHFSATFGSLILTILVLFRGTSWREPIIGMAICAGLLGLIAIFSNYGTHHKQTRENMAKLTAGDLFGQGGLWMLFVSIFIAIGLEAAILGYVPSIYSLIWGFDDFQAKTGLLVTITGIALSRFLSGFLFKNHTMDKAIVILLVLCTFLSILVCFVPCHVIMLHVFVFLLGLVMAPIAPFAMTIAGMRYPDRAGSVLGILKISIPLGAIMVPLAISVMTDLTGFQTSLVLLPAVCLLSVIVLLPLVRTNRGLQYQVDTLRS